MKRCRLKRYNFQIKNDMGNTKQTEYQPHAGNTFIADVMGITPREKWENLKKYILTQTEKIDKETPWQNSEPEWWLEMQTIERNIRQYWL